jgi:tetratricopeptide (TPR) repeat protein
LRNKVLLKRGLEFAAKEDLQQATELFRQAIEETPNDSEAYNCLGAVQYRTNLLEEAEFSFRRALELNPENPDALCNLGTLFISTQRLKAAKNCLERVIQICPNYPEAHGNLGLIQMQECLFVEANLSFQRAIELNPNSPYAYNNLGLVQMQQCLVIEAELSFRQAIGLKPNFPEAYNNLGITLKNMSRLEEAAKYIYRATKLNPNYAEAYNSLGTVLTDADRNEVAESCFYRAIRIKPNYPEPYHNLGVLFTNTNRLDQAETCFCQALKINPNFTEAEFSLATLYLLQARYEKGWEKYDKSRMTQHNHVQPNIPRWSGENLAGRKILLYHEQGFGDTLHFVRYAHLVEKLADQTVLWVQKPLQRLIDSSFPSIEVHGIEDIQDIPPGEFDFSCPLPSLPRVFNTSSKNIPQTIPYIKVCSKITTKWDNFFNPLNKNSSYKIGVVWAGNPNHHNDRNRSIPLEVFSDLFAVKAVTWISLQAGIKSQDLVKIPYKVFSHPEKMKDFAETAGLITHLDLIITVDSAVAHLAGAMGKQTWLLLPFAPDWRWQINRQDSPWYPTIQLFRQRKAGDWPEVLVRVKQALALQLQDKLLYAEK